MLSCLQQHIENLIKLKYIFKCINENITDSHARCVIFCFEFEKKMKIAKLNKKFLNLIMYLLNYLFLKTNLPSYLENFVKMDSMTYLLQRIKDFKTICNTPEKYSS